jgi:hypothetical protein
VSVQLRLVGACCGVLDAHEETIDSMGAGSIWDASRLWWRELRQMVERNHKLSECPIPTLASSSNCVCSKELGDSESQWLTVWLTTEAMVSVWPQNSGTMLP